MIHKQETETRTVTMTLKEYELICVYLRVAPAYYPPRPETDEAIDEFVKWLS